MKRKNLTPRGGAAVEMSIMMVVLIPLIMYVSFLQDALLYKLDAQEAIVSAPYDFVTQDYEKTVNAGDIQHYNRLTHCDHTSATNSYSDSSYDCDNGASEGHHTSSAKQSTAWSAHQCWLVPGAEQVTCGWGNKGVPLASPFSVYAWSARFNEGGIARCYGNIGIMNYFLPQKFFNFWAKANVDGGKGGTRDGTAVGLDDGNARLKKFDQADGVHKSGAYSKAGSKNALLLPTEEFAMLHDPWALNHLEDVEPNDFAPMTNAMVPGTSGITHHPLLDRSAHYYTYWGGTWISLPGSSIYMRGGQSRLQAAKDFHEAIEDFVSYWSRMDMFGDHLGSMPVFYSAGDQTRSNAGGYASGWEDSRQNDMYGSRQTTYYGMDQNWW